MYIDDDSRKPSLLHYRRLWASFAKKEHWQRSPLLCIKGRLISHRLIKHFVQQVVLSFTNQIPTIRTMQNCFEQRSSFATFDYTDGAKGVLLDKLYLVYTWECRFSAVQVKRIVTTWPVQKRKAHCQQRKSSFVRIKLKNIERFDKLSRNS